MNDMILDDAFEQPLKLAVKINFLQHEKDNLEENVRQMSDNMKIYKRIIEQLTDATHQQSAVLTENAMKLAVLQLTKINDKLNDKVECLMEEISSLKCTVLLKDQIMEEQQQQNQSVLKNYQEKILELRRAIQDKEYAIQQKQNPRTRGEQRSKKDYVMDPKHQAMRLNTEVQQLKELVRKLTIDNNELRKKNTEMTTSLSQEIMKANKMESLLESSVSYHTARMLYIKNSDKLRPMSEQKIILSKAKNTMGSGSKNIDRIDSNKQQINFTKRRSSKVYNGNNYSDGYHVRNETMTYLRQLLFREKTTSDMLAKSLTELNHSYASLANSNKLLAQSNINYQIKRTKLQEQLNFYKRKNQQLLSIVMRKRVRLNRSLERSNDQTVLKSIPVEQEVQHNYSEHTHCLKNMQNEIQQATNTLARITTRSFFQRVKERRNRHISYSCPTDYLPKQELDSVEQFIKKQQQKLKKEEPNRKQNDNPFLADYSIIKIEKQPISFADFSNSHAFGKRKLISDSFIQITEEILKK